MGQEEDITAAQAELDQANAAVTELQADFDGLTAAATAAEQARADAVTSLRAQVQEANATLQPISVEMEKRQGAVRTAQAKLEAAQSGENYTPPAPQGVE